MELTQVLGEKMSIIRVRSRTRGCLAVVLVLAWLAWALPGAAAERRTVQLDPAQTRIEFTLGDILHTVHGSFRLYSGAIHFDPASGEADGELIVDAASGDSGNGSRDGKMKKEILEVGKYPEIVFVARRIVGHVPAQGDGAVDVQGVFQIHGADHDLTLHVPLTVGNGTVKLTTQFVVPYQAWGMKNPSTLFLRVDNTVQIKITGLGHLSSQ